MDAVTLPDPDIERLRARRPPGASRPDAFPCLARVLASMAVPRLDDVPRALMHDARCVMRDD